MVAAGVRLNRYRDHLHAQIAGYGPCTRSVIMQNAALTAEAKGDPALTTADVAGNILYVRTSIWRSAFGETSRRKCAVFSCH